MARASTAGSAADSAAERLEGVSAVKSGGMLKAYRASDECRGARSLLDKGDHAAFAGFHGASLAFFLSALLEPADGPTFVVTATQEEAEELRDELEAYSGRPALFVSPWESLFMADSRPDEDIYHDRLLALKSLGEVASDELSFMIAPVHAVIQPVPSAAEIGDAVFTIKRDEDLSRDDFAARLTGLDFRHVPLVLRRGEYSVRGDILDVFPFDRNYPLRIEFFGNTIDSIREFYPESQRSTDGDGLKSCRILLPPQASMFKDCARDEDPLLLDHLPKGSRCVLYDPVEICERAQTIFSNVVGGDEAETLFERFWARLQNGRRLSAYPLAFEAGVRGQTLGFVSVERFQGADLENAMRHLSEATAKGGWVEVACDSTAENERIRAIFQDHAVPGGDEIVVRANGVRRGFESRAIGGVLLTTRELFNRLLTRRTRRQQVETQAIRGFFDLDEGDLVVHITHGIGRFLGIRQMEKDDVVQEYLELEYRNRVKVYVPVSKIDLVQKYVGAGTSRPNLDRIGGASWNKRKEAVEQSILEFANDLLEVHARREARSGHAYPQDTDWQRQLEASFAFEDTPDQREATKALKADLESDRPMDRLLCGDVGYGKTELAIRSAFKVVNEGKQVAMLVPTTLLAQQHYRTFSERLAGFPVRVEQLSRFCSAKRARSIVEDTNNGKVDILIGTHRILSKDVEFADVGLIVIDEEQRFGVKHKEQLKRMRSLVEILTMTATPIPRTLHMSLLGIRDISSLSTPPEGRSPIVTEVMEFDRAKIREAILRELNREGQVYFVHNRVNDIQIVRQELEAIVPEAVIDVGHGQMSEHELEDIMMRFLSKKVDVLIATTIIETGIDIPNVNTIFIHECDRFGLADLHQLRGRVGRSRHKAYCYLVLPDHRHVNPDARKRVQAIREFSDLGAGFQIAMRDLEIRGAGNILGAEQSGHIAVVGYDLYCRLLERAVKKQRGQEPEQAVDVQLELNVEAYLPEDLVPSRSTRLDLYRRLSRMQELDEVEELSREIRDRFGELTPPARRLLDVQILRILSLGVGLRGIAYDEESILLNCTDEMQSLLDSCRLRAVVLAPDEIALVVNDPTRARRTRLDDELVFTSVLKWLRTGKFPRLPRR